MILFFEETIATNNPISIGINPGGSGVVTPRFWDGGPYEIPSYPMM